MGYRRLPTFLVNFPLRLMPFTEKQKKTFEATGHVSEVAFKTIPSVGKLEIKQYLEKVYGLAVAGVRTLNYEGRKKVMQKNGKAFYVRRSDYKKAYVSLLPPRGYFLRFHLISASGTEVLAATGEDHGDAHYTYRSVRDFPGRPAIACHNRRELTVWLEGVIRDSQAAGYAVPDGGTHDGHATGPAGPDAAPGAERTGEAAAAAAMLPVAAAAAPALHEQPPAMPPGMPPFVAYRQEKLAPEGGPRLQRWWLQDARGGEVLAALGEERENRDGHYIYRAAPAFAAERPLAAGNMAAVHAWLEQMLVGPARTGGAASMSAGARSGASGGEARRESRSWARVRLAAQQAASTMSAGAGPDGPQAAAAGEGSGIDQPPPPAPAAAPADRLGAAAAALGAALAGALGALRALGALHAPLRLLTAPGLLGTVARLRAHPEPAIAALASDTLDGWRRTTAAHGGVSAAGAGVDPAGAVVSYARRQKGRLAACRLGAVQRVARQATAGVLGRLAAAPAPEALQHVRDACAAVEKAAASVQRGASMADNRAAQRGALAAMQRLVVAAEALL
ncbi:hypothetical protein WJX81_004801 [Elliptochloris bilobata]|uniref:Large ribosomal subunit protein uL23c n=1 Tax=Elliptochloris bilobata TaxID=381761 RepID=A0AAW1QA81_9CHLO